MALLHRERPDAATTSDTTAHDTVAGPAWPVRTDQPREAHAERVVRRNSIGQTLRTIVATVILVGVVAIAAANTGSVDVDLLYDRESVSLAALVGGAAGAGFLIGALLVWRGRRRAHPI